jgi:hypothetical protein
MRRFWLLVSTLFIYVIPSIAADQSAWGPTVDGLKMSIAITGGIADGELQITVKNVSNEPISLSLGRILNQRTTVVWFRVFVTTPDGTERTAVSGPAKIGGSFAITPLTIELVPNASYTTATPLTGMKDVNGPTDLKALLSKGSQLRVELDTTKTECPEGCVPGTVLSCWHGKLVSNVPQLLN